MVMAVGCARPDAGMYHLVTHAFFRALLFLGAGAMSMRCTSIIWKMGGLRSRAGDSWTFWRNPGVVRRPPLSGFYSKDGILAAAESRHIVHPGLAGGGVDGVLHGPALLRGPARAIH
jgi:NADH-quinone oxidoreductase subunit L